MKNIENMNNNDLVITDDEVNETILKAFDHAVHQIMSEETKYSAFELAKMYFGEGITLNSGATLIMAGFMCGLNEGMRIGIAAEGDTELLAELDNQEK